MPLNRKLNLSQGCTVELSAMMPVGTDAKPSQRKFSMQAYSGDKVGKFVGNVVFNLAGMNVAGNGQVIPILKNHDPEQIVGHSTSIQKTDTALLVNGMISSLTDAAKEVCALADEGFPWQVSTGLEIGDVSFVPEKQSAQVNGRKFDGPIYVVHTSTLKECSFVPAGADSNTSGVVLSFSDLVKNSPARGVDANVKELAMPEVNTEKLSSDASLNALKTERNRVAAINARFVSHPKFVLEQAASDNTLEQAEIAFKDVLIAEQTAKITAMESAQSQQAASKPTNGTTAVPFGSTAAESGAPKRGDFMQQSRDYAAAKNCSMTAAMSHISVAEKGLHAAYVEGIRPIKLERN